MSFFDNKITQRLGGLEFGKETEIYKFELSKRAKAEARRMHPGLPLTEDNGFLPDLDAVSEAILKKAKLLYINYPNNPTGAVCRVFHPGSADFGRPLG